MSTKEKIRNEHSQTYTTVNHLKEKSTAVEAMIILDRAKKLNESIFKREKTKKRWKNQTHDRHATDKNARENKKNILILSSESRNAYSSLFLQLAFVQTEYSS